MWFWTIMWLCYYYHSGVVIKSVTEFETRYAYCILFIKIHVWIFMDQTIDLSVTSALYRRILSDWIVQSYLIEGALDRVGGRPGCGRGTKQPALSEKLLITFSKHPVFPTLDRYYNLLLYQKIQISFDSWNRYLNTYLK